MPDAGALKFIILESKKKFKITGDSLQIGGRYIEYFGMVTEYATLRNTAHPTMKTKTA